MVVLKGALASDTRSVESFQKCLMLLKISEALNIFRAFNMFFKKIKEQGIFMKIFKVFIFENFENQKFQNY